MKVIDWAISQATFLNASGVFFFFKKQAFLFLTMVNNFLKQYRGGQNRRCYLVNDEILYNLQK